MTGEGDKHLHGQPFRASRFTVHILFNSQWLFPAWDQKSRLGLKTPGYLFPGWSRANWIPGFISNFLSFWMRLPSPECLGQLELSKDISLIDLWDAIDKPRLAAVLQVYEKHPKPAAVLFVVQRRQCLSHIRVDPWWCEYDGLHEKCVETTYSAIV